MSGPLSNALMRLNYGAPPKRRVFVSYHHDADQVWYDIFDRYFASTLELFTNRSLPEPIDSDQVDYVHRYIREQHLTGTSLTIVLCGSETWKRKWIDWEIGSTLNKEHRLLGIALPTILRDGTGSAIVPNRLHLNVVSGYARFIEWTADPMVLQREIEAAVLCAWPRSIANAEPFMQRNLS